MKATAKKTSEHVQLAATGEKRNSLCKNKIKPYC
jgi:hypothetical protein